MTENEHNYKGPTPTNVTYARFEIQLIDLPSSQASQVFGRKRNCERSAPVALDYRDESVSWVRDW